VHEPAGLAGHLVEHRLEPEVLHVGFVERRELRVRPSAIGEARRDDLPVRLVPAGGDGQRRRQVAHDIVAAEPALEPRCDDVAGALTELVHPPPVLVADEVGLARSYESGDPSRSCPP